MQDKNDKYNISGAQFTQPAEEFQVRSATSGIAFDFEEVQPILGSYIGVDDSLDISLFANSGSNTCFVNVRVLGLDGLVHPFQFAQVYNNNRAAQRFRFQLMEGFILSISATSNALPNSQFWFYATIGLTRSPFGLNNEYETLCSGYLYQNVPLCYPTSPHQRPTDGAGVIVSFNQGAPAAGADLTITVPTGARWRFVSFRATLTTAVAVANRLVSLVLDDGANIFAESPSNFTQAASIVNTYNAFDSAPYLNVPFNLRTLQPSPSNVFLAPGFRIRTVTTNIQGADQWSAAQLEIMEWLDNA